MMGRFRQVALAAMLGAWAAIVLPSYVRAETSSNGKTWTVRSTRDYWEQQVLRGGARHPAASIPATAEPAMVDRQAAAWAPAEPALPEPPMAPDAEVLPPAEPETEAAPGAEMMLGEMETIPKGQSLAPLPDDAGYYAPGPSAMGGCELGGASCGACYADGSCGECYGDGAYGPCSGYWGFRGACAAWYHRHCWWVRNLSLFAGVHGFKGPADLGRNGNFGFHEGLNWGAPLGDPFGIGFQLGAQAAHSNFSGDQTASSITTADRNQIFFTGGLFRRRLCGGMQWGVVFDLLYDTYHGDATLGQIRTEASLAFSGCREIGYSGAYGVNDDTLTYGNARNRLTEPLSPTDTFTLFYRRYFSGGGRGRLTAGVSGNGDALVGADCTVPLGTSWALENNFLYLAPKEGGQAGQREETWSVSISLVWYPGREAASVFTNPFHPMFNVADNSQFLLKPR